MVKWMRLPNDCWGDALGSVQERGTAKGSANLPPAVAWPWLAASHVTDKKGEPLRQS
jgi:hypothetical protein